MKKILDLFVFGNIYVALPVSALAWVTFLLFNTEVNYQILLFIYLSTFSIYNIHRLVGLKQVPENQRSPRHIWALKNQGYFFASICFGLAGSAYTAFNLGKDFWLVLIPSGLIAVGYSFPLIKRQGKIWRLRDLPFAKVFLVSLTVSYVTTYLPLYHQFLYDPTNLFMLGSFGARAFFLLAITIPFDIRDVEFDAPSTLNTLPLIFGIEKAKTISLYALSFFAGLSFFLFRESVFAAIALMLSAIITAWIVSYAKKDSSEYYFSLLVEGTMILQLALVWLFIG